MTCGRLDNALQWSIKGVKVTNDFSRVVRSAVDVPNVWYVRSCYCSTAESGVARGNIQLRLRDLGPDQTSAPTLDPVDIPDNRPRRDVPCWAVRRMERGCRGGAAAAGNIFTGRGGAGLGGPRQSATLAVRPRRSEQLQSVAWSLGRAEQQPPTSAGRPQGTPVTPWVWCGQCGHWTLDSGHNTAEAPTQEFLCPVILAAWEQ